MGPTEVFAHRDTNPVYKHKLFDRSGCQCEKTQTQGILYRSVLCQCKVSFIPKRDIHHLKKEISTLHKESKTNFITLVILTYMIIKYPPWGWVESAEMLSNEFQVAPFSVSKWIYCVLEQNLNVPAN